MRKFFSTFVAVLALVSFLGLNLHSHKDGAKHKDCPTCVSMSHSQAVAADGSPEIKSHENIVEYVYHSSLSIIHAPFAKGVPGRSPPVIS